VLLPVHAVGHVQPPDTIRRKRASDLLESVKKIQRDYAGLRVLIEELVTALRADAEMWQSRYEAERADHERTIAHAERAMNEDVP
jgi:hypothetical protein